MCENTKILTTCQIFSTKISRCYYFLLEGYWLASQKSAPFIEMVVCFSFGMRFLWFALSTRNSNLTFKLKNLVRHPNTLRYSDLRNDELVWSSFLDDMQGKFQLQPSFPLYVHGVKRDWKYCSEWDSIHICPTLPLPLEVLEKQTKHS